MAVQLDLDLLPPGLKAFPDDIGAGGTPGHWTISPVDGTGQPDPVALREWVEWTGTDPHPFTAWVQQTIVARVPI